MKRLVMIAVAVAALCVGQAVGLDAQAKAKAMNASGTVKAVTGNSLTVTAAGGKDMTFTIDNTTKFVGKGLGTKAKAGPITATDAVATGDKVRVTYHDMGGALHAASVSVTTKAGK
jgi:predicted lipoprotein with Yx(FWY)xxD motif